MSIEHNLEVIKCADWIIDLGPEAGEEGGQFVATGTPEEVANVDASHTGRFLRELLGKTGRLPRTRNGRSQADDGELALRAAEEPPAQWPNGTGQRPGLLGTAANRRNHSIAIHGAREHNLKNISLDIPRDKMVIITGLSGSGKSTLAFDLLFAEGQRRFLDSMSPYARQFVEQLEKPDVDLIAGLPPSVAIEQRVTRGGGKSTVATVTEVYHFLRLLFAKTGTQFCPECDLAGRKTERCRDRQAGGSGGAARTAQGARAAGQGAQGFSHRRGALGGAAGIRHTFRRWQADPGRAISKARTLQRTHDRRRSSA